jgi:hypothetical protein
MVFNERGQAHALEAFTAALLLLAGLLFALQATAVTPLSASTSNQHLENQQQKMAGDILSSLDHTGDIQNAVLNWSDGGFGNKTNGTVYTNPENISKFGRFGEVLNETLLEEGTALNVYVQYRENRTEKSQTMIFMGTPSDNAVVATRKVTLIDSNTLTGTNTTLASGSHFAPDAAPGDALYNVVEVRIVLWQN